MKRRFRHKGLDRLFTGRLAPKMRRMLILLDTGKDPPAQNMPGYRVSEMDICARIDKSLAV